ncbi:MAG: hypothetical protein K0Q65_3 [Clostridia bacterium]|nr:hypothetical protein [Clostridia bacterium]
MKKVFSPLFIIAFVTLPQLLSLGYLSAAFGPANIQSLTIPLITIFFINVLFVIYAYKQHKEEVIHTKVFMAISAIFTTIIALSILFGPQSFFLDASTSPKLIYITACIVSVIYGIMGIAYNTTPPGKTYDIARYVVGIVFTPFLWFLRINFISGVNSNAIMLMLIIASVYTLIFFIIKIFFIWRLRKAPFSFDAVPQKRNYIAVAVLALCMPLLGLLVNQTFSDFGIGNNSSGLFGDFSHPMFYIIAALNGILLLIPPVKNKSLRLTLFFLKSAGYTYILYFFVVFIPLLPLGLVGIIFYGLGLLILVPLFVALLQGYHLFKEWVILSKLWDIWQVAAVFCIGIIVLPLCITATVWGDRANFITAAQYLEQKDLNHSAPVDLKKLQRSLDNIEGNLQATRGVLGMSSNNTPILSQLYTHLILDGKILSQNNVLTLENLFFDAGHDLAANNLSNPDIVNNNVRLIDALSETRFDDKAGVYRSRINLKLENSPYAENGEYITTFKLPDGAYISDYYLDVFGKRKEGLLTDRRTALFIYSKIVNTRRDPGLLHYIGKNTLELRVFPFAANEVRETGFEIIHSQRLDLTLDNKIISLGGDDAQKEIKVKGAVLLPAAEKAALRSVKREPKYYFVIDSSNNSDIPWHISQIQAYTMANQIEEAEVIFTSYKLQKQNLADMTQAKYAAEGGFNLNMAVNNILNSHDKNTFPIIIAVSDTMPSAVFPRNIQPLSGKFPESLYYYALNPNLTLTPYTYEDNKAEHAVEEPIITPILDYNGSYVLDNNENELVLTDASADKFFPSGNQYEDAVLLDVIQQKSMLAGEATSVEMVRASFRAKILTPQTAFIVVETPEQEKELLDLQERMLNNNESVPTVTLDEPPLEILILLFLLVMLLTKHHKKKPLLKN